MAKPNYQFEKRQRDLAKKQKQEEKRQKKGAERGADKATDGSSQDVGSDPSNAAPADAGNSAETTGDGGTGPEA